MCHGWLNLAVPQINSPLVSHFLLPSLQTGQDFRVSLKMSFLKRAALVWLKGGGQWKTKSPLGGCQGFAFAASWSGGRSQEWKLLAEGPDLPCTPCRHRGVLGELQEKLHFRRLLKVVLWDSQVDLSWRSEWCAGEWCVGRNVSRENTWLVAAIFGTLKNHRGSSSSLSCYFTSCSAPRNQLRRGCRHLQGGRN